MRLLVTRPLRKARALAQTLEAMGHQVTVEPMLDIHLLPLPRLDPDKFDAVMFTSANGVDAMHAAGAVAEFAQTPVFCVGEATARSAGDAGFVNVTSASGDAAALAGLMAGRLAPGRVLHVRGRHGLAEPAATLRRAGFTCDAITGYDARPRPALSATTAAALQAGQFDAVVLYSPRSAEILGSLVENIGLKAPFSVAFCLSAAISRAAAPLAGQTRAPATPDGQALLEMIAG